MKGKIELRSGKRTLSLALSQRLKVKMYVPQRTRRIDTVRRLQEAIDGPIDSEPLRGIIRRAKRITICIPDRTRPRIARDLLPEVIGTLEREGVNADDLTILIANGSHSKHTRADIADVVGEEVASRIRVKQNLSHTDTDFVAIGKTSRGTPIAVNRSVVDCDLTILISTVTTHYFAGWGGGRKMILPGVSALETIRANHRLTLTSDGDLDERCSSGCLEGNPVHEDMLEAASMVENVFCINVVINGYGEPAEITAGRLDSSHEASVKIASRMLRVDVPEPCDLAIASAGGYPFDIDFIQSHKSIDHVAGCVRDGGVIVMVAECSQGEGSDTFLPWFDIGDRRAVASRLKSNYQLNGHTALALMKKLERLKIVLVSSLAEAKVRKMGMLPAKSLDEALKIADGLLNGAVTTYVFPFAWGILPVA